MFSATVAATRREPSHVSAGGVATTGGTTMTDDKSLHEGIEFNRRDALKGGAAGLGLLALGGLGSGSAAAENGANKVFAAEQDLKRASATFAKNGTSNADEITLASGSFKTSDKSDLIIQATAEVGLYTDVKTKGNDESTAKAGVTCWVELDGQPVSWNVANPLGDGKVVFDNREFGLKTSNFDDEDAMIELFIKTRSAHGFNWYTADVGSDTHTIELKATIDEFVEGSGDAEALVGPRTLIVEPVNMGST